MLLLLLLLLCRLGDQHGRRHILATAALTYPANRCRIQIVPADGKPRPLGLLRADATVTIAVPANLAALTVGNAVLAVSLEPPGGSPTGAPTGPVIGTGKLTSL